MTRGSPAASGPLLVLTLAVLAVHFLLLGQTASRDPPSRAGARVFLTRVMSMAQPAQPADPAPAAGAPSPPGVPLAPTSPVHAVRRGTPAPDRIVQLAAPTPAVAAQEPAQQGAAEAAPSMALAVPAPVQLSYQVTGLSRGKTWAQTGRLAWRHDGSQYDATLEYSAPALPSRSQRSTGRITAQGLAPSRFSDKARSEQATHFERDSGTLVFSSNAPQLPLLAGAQDRLSVFLQLASMLAADPAKFPAGTEISIVTASTRDAQPWTFTVDGDATLVLPGGAIPTRKLVRMPRREYDLRVELWLGTGMDYVPVRIRLTQANGDYVDQQWSSTDRP